MANENNSELSKNRDGQDPEELSENSRNISEATETERSNQQYPNDSDNKEYFHEAVESNIPQAYTLESNESEKSDFDSLLNQQYWDELADKASLKSRARERLREDDSKPLFTDMLEADDSIDSYLQDPQDFTDVTAVAKKRKVLKMAGVATLALAVLVTGGYYVAQSMTNTSEHANTQIEEIENGDKTIDGETENTQKPRVRPLLDDFPKAPKVAHGKTIAKAKGSVIKTDEGAKMTMQGVMLIPSQTECSVTDPENFCLVARTTDEVFEGDNPDVKSKDLNIYFFKDAVRSRIFENPENFKKVEIPGSATAGVMTVDLAGEKTTILTVVNRDSSGYMITLAKDTTPDDAAVLATAIIVS